jgi:hypothetical protein
MRHHQARWRRVRDWLLYVVIAVLILAVVAAFAVHQARTGGSPDLPLKWIGFVGMTAIVFGYAIRACRRLWRTPKFWLLLTVFFVVHSGVGVFVLRVATVPLILYAILTGMEYVLLAAYLGFFLDSK